MNLCSNSLNRHVVFGLDTIPEQSLVGGALALGIKTPEVQESINALMPGHVLKPASKFEHMTILWPRLFAHRRRQEIDAYTNMGPDDIDVRPPVFYSTISRKDGYCHDSSCVDDT